MKEEDIKLGFCDPPVPTYIYVGDSGDKDCPWYELDYKDNKKIPIKHKAIVGKIMGLKLVKKTHKKKDTIKLDISFQAEKRYIIRSGVETYFTRSFLLAAQTMDMTDETVILVASPGNDQSVVFCKVYYAINEERIKTDWDPDCKLHPIVNALQTRMNIHPQTLDEVMSGEEHKDGDDDLSPVDRMIKEDPLPKQTPAPQAAEPKAEAEQPQEPKAENPPAEKVQVPAESRTPAHIAAASRTMGPEYYATEIDDVIEVGQLGKLRALVGQLGITDDEFCKEVMGCEPSDLSVKGADHLIHFAEVKIKGDDKTKK